MDLVGADLSGIELRCLAHFLSRYDEITPTHFSMVTSSGQCGQDWDHKIAN